MQWTHYHQVVMASRYGSPPLWDFRPCRYKKISSYRTAIRDGQYTDALVQHPLPPWYWEKCGTMGCSILFKMVTEWIGLSATLATRRMGHGGSVCVNCGGMGGRGVGGDNSSNMQIHTLIIIACVVILRLPRGVTPGFKANNNQQTYYATGQRCWN